MKVEPSRKREIGTASFQEGGGAVFLEKKNQKLGLRVAMMFIWMMIVSAMYMTATTCRKIGEYDTCFLRHCQVCTPRKGDLHD